MKKYCLVGEKLSYSYSKIIHEYLAQLLKIDLTYDLVEVSNINDFDINNYDGFNVTIPYKQDIKKLLTNVNTNLGVNTVANKCGYNTDILGFDYTYKLLKASGVNKVVILGSGASSKMVQEYFKDKEIEVISRSNGGYDKPLKGDLLVNTTPIGMADSYDEILFNPDDLYNFKYVIDLNYNPNINRLLHEAARRNVVNINGLYMLVVQAVRAFELFNDIDIKDDVINDTYNFLIRRVTKGRCIIGMPMSGKTSTYTGIDTDKEIEKDTGMSIEDIFKTYGEAYFRDLETNKLIQLVTEGHNSIISGGGIILNFDNRYILREYNIVFHDVELKKIKQNYRDSKAKRPLIKSNRDITETYNTRYNKYLFFQTRKVVTYEDLNH